MTYVAVLNRECILETGFETFEHLCIVTIITDVVQDVLVWNDVERSEHHNDRDIITNIRQRRFDGLSALSMITAPSASDLRAFNVCLTLTDFSVRRIILICIDEIVLPPFSTADRISAKNVIGEG